MGNNITKALLSLLNKGIVDFTYRKVDGSIRHAVGTRNLCLACQALGLSIPMPKTGRENPTAYYDIEKNAWRSFVAENVLSINGVDIAEIKGIKNDRIVPIGSMEEVEIPININGGFGGGFAEPKDKVELPINKFDLGKISKAISGMPLGGGFGGIKKGELPKRTEKVGTPTFTDKGLELPLGSVSIDDFAKLVAKYVVDEIVGRLTK